MEQNTYSAEQRPFLRQLANIKQKKARRGKARQGKARQGKAKQSKAREERRRELK